MFGQHFAECRSPVRAHDEPSCREIEAVNLFDGAKLTPYRIQVGCRRRENFSARQVGNLSVRRGQTPPQESVTVPRESLTRNPYAILGNLEHYVIRGRAICMQPEHSLRGSTLNGLAFVDELLICHVSYDTVDRQGGIGVTVVRFLLRPFSASLVNCQVAFTGFGSVAIRFLVGIRMAVCRRLGGVVWQFLLTPYRRIRVCVRFRVCALGLRALEIVVGWIV